MFHQRRVGGSEEYHGGTMPRQEQREIYRVAPHQGQYCSYLPVDRFYFDKVKTLCVQCQSDWFLLRMVISSNYSLSWDLLTVWLCSRFGVPLVTGPVCLVKMRSADSLSIFHNVHVGASELIKCPEVSGGRTVVCPPRNVVSLMVCEIYSRYSSQFYGYYNNNSLHLSCCIPPTTHIISYSEILTL